MVRKGVCAYRGAAAPVHQRQVERPQDLLQRGEGIGVPATRMVRVGWVQAEYLDGVLVGNSVQRERSD